MVPALLIFGIICTLGLGIYFICESFDIEPDKDRSEGRADFLVVMIAAWFTFLTVILLTIPAFMP